MIINYDNGVYNIYLSKSRENPEDEIHIANSDIKTVRELFVGYIDKRLNKFSLMREFDRNIKECIEKQL